MPPERGSCWRRTDNDARKQLLIGVGAKPRIGGTHQVRIRPPAIYPAVLREQKIGLSGRKSRWCNSNDPEFVTEAADIVGLYMMPPQQRNYRRMANACVR